MASLRISNRQVITVTGGGAGAGTGAGTGAGLGVGTGAGLGAGCEDTSVKKSRLKQRKRAAVACDFTAIFASKSYRRESMRRRLIGGAGLRGIYRRFSLLSTSILNGRHGWKLARWKEMAVAHASWTATAYVSFRMPSTTDRADRLGLYRQVFHRNSRKSTTVLKERNGGR